jgi:hypothetical protein
MDYQTPTPYDPYQQPGPTGPTHSLGERIIGALKLDRGIFDEVRRDPSAMIQAAGIIVATGLLSGIGQFAAVRGQTLDDGDTQFDMPDSFLVPLLGGLGIAVAGLIFWILGAVLFRFVAVRFMGSPETNIQWQEVARPLGFASAPSLLLILTPIPVIGVLISSVVGLWGFAAQIVALSETFGVSKLRSFAIILVTALVLSLVLVIPICICVFIAVALAG